MGTFGRMQLILLAVMAVVGQPGWTGEVKLGISLGGTHLAGIMVEYRQGDVALVASLGSAVPGRLRDLSLAVQARQYFPSGLYLGLGGWWFLVREAGQWGWLISWHLAGGWGGETWEMGVLWHRFLIAHWGEPKVPNFPSLILPQVAFKWCW